jgi:hypothetical protein
VSEQTGAAWPRPLGIQRDDTLLSLDEAAVPARRALVCLARQLYSVTLGVNCPNTNRAGERIRHPQVGDFVVETSSRIPLDVDTLLKCHGYLLEHRRRFGEGDEAWSEVVWYVQYGPSPEDVCRWANADFAAVPINGERWGPPLRSGSCQSRSASRSSPTSGVTP